MKRYILILITIVFGALSLFAQDKASEINNLMQAYYDLGKFNGTVLVAESGKVIYKKGFGLANMEWNIPNEPDTKFRIASLTKQFTSMLVMQLVEEGRIKLDGKISDYLPEYKKDIGEKVSIHHLLTHTSGIPDYRYLPDFKPFDIQDPYAIDEFVQKYCDRDLEFEPGSEWRYNNSGYYLLGAIVEKVTGKTYEACLKEKIFDPLGMKNSGYAHNHSVLTNCASGYVKTVDRYENAMYVPMIILYAAAATFSTVEDLYLWDQALYTEKLLSNEYKDIMFKPYLFNYAYGWSITKSPISGSNDSVLVIMHPGSMPGFQAKISRVIHDKHLIVLLDNSGGSIDMSQGIITKEIINILYGKPYAMPKMGISEVLYETILNKDVASAKKQYYELKNMYPDDYDFSRNELNYFGYMLQEEGMLDEAIEIYNWIIEIDPASWEAYNSIAVTYRAKGENEMAIKYYAKSLEMNPEMWYAISISEILKELTEEDN